MFNTLDITLTRAEAELSAGLTCNQLMADRAAKTLAANCHYNMFATDCNTGGALDSLPRKRPYTCGHGSL